MKLKSLLLTLGATLAVGLGALAGVTSMNKGTKEVKAAISSGQPIFIQQKYNWNQLSGDYVIEFANETSSQEVSVGNIWNYESTGSQYKIYNYNSSDFSFTPTKARVKKDSYATDYVSVSDIEGKTYPTFWLPDNPGATEWNGGVYDDNSEGNYHFDELTITASFSTAAPAGQTVYIGSNLNNWSPFIELSPDSTRQVFSVKNYVTHDAASFAYKLLTADDGVSMGWSGTGISIIKDDGNGGNASGTISNHACALVTNDSHFDVTYYEVTKIAVEFNDNGATGVTWDMDPEYVAEEASYSPATVYYNLEHFVGWYTNAACTTAYTGTDSMSSDITIYGKYMLLTDDSYIYYISEGKSTFTHVHFWGEKQDDNNNGVAISTYERHGVVTFNGLSQNIYKIPVPSSGDVYCKFHDGSWGVETYQIDVTPGTAYYLYLKDGESSYSWSANSEAAAALDIIFRVEDLRNGVKDEEDFLDYSICGIDPEKAKKLYEDYIALSDDEGKARQLIDRSSTYTYDRLDSSTQTTVSYYYIMRELAQLAVDNGYTVTGYSVKTNGIFNLMSENSNNTLIIIAIAGVSLLAVAGFFLLKRKEER